MDALQINQSQSDHLPPAEAKILYEEDAELVSVEDNRVGNRISLKIIMDD